jgi:hypothetical protein
VYVSEKFASDHLCKSKADAKNTAKGRLYRANPAPASTAIDKGSYMDGLNTYVKSMNDAGVFNAVTYYMKTKFNWNPEGSSVDSVIYLAPTKIMATTYRPKPNGAATQAMNEAQQEGHLAFSVQEDSSVPGRYLLYHYHDIVAPANVGTPANFKAPQNGNWVALTANAVVEMLQGLNTGGRGKVSTEDVAKIRAAYYHVYYAKV